MENNYKLLNAASIICFNKGKKILRKNKLLLNFELNFFLYISLNEFLKNFESIIVKLYKNRLFLWILTKLIYKC